MSVTLNRGRRAFTSSKAAVPPQNAFGEVVEYLLKETPAKVRIKLLMPLKHGDKTIEAGTIVEAYTRPPAANQPKRVDDKGNELLPRSVERMVRAVGTGAPLAAGSVVELDTVWIDDKTGALSFRGAHGIAPISTMKPETVTNPENGEEIHLKAKNVPMANVMWMVGNVRPASSPTSKPRQSATILLAGKTTLAQPRDGSYMPFIESFVKAIVNAPTSEGKSKFDFLSTTAFAVIARRLEGAENPQSRNATLTYLFQKKDEGSEVYRPQTVEEALATFQAQLAAEEDEEGVDKMIDILSGKVPGYQVEAIPGIYADLPPDMVSTKNRMHDQCKLFEGDENKISVFGLGFVHGYVAFSRFALSDNYSVKALGATDKYPAAFALMDIPTVHMPKEHLDAVNQLAKGNSELARIYFASKKEKPQDQEGDGSAPADQIPF